MLSTILNFIKTKKCSYPAEIKKKFNLSDYETTKIINSLITSNKVKRTYTITSFDNNGNLIAIDNLNRCPSIASIITFLED